MKAFKDRVAVITGAASGIGRALADRCAQEGMRVVIADVEAPALARAKAELQAAGADVLAVLADVHSNLLALEAVLADVQRHHVDGIIVASDHITGGPCPVQVLRSLGCWMIQGNCENYL